mmetsp:Transcript_2054/g.4644  ORF Transcript_2054/g.4644 Transcript_2054/m.4644 type:complete len:225 (-) Transcript_2054:315-989(-)
MTRYARRRRGALPPLGKQEALHLPLRTSPLRGSSNRPCKARGARRTSIRSWTSCACFPRRGPTSRRGGRCTPFVVGPPTGGSGAATCGTGLECSTGQMAPSTRASGTGIRQSAWAASCTPTGMSTVASGTTTSLTGSESTGTRRLRPTPENGPTTFRAALVLRLGRRAAAMRASSRLGRRMALASTAGGTHQRTTATGAAIASTALVYTKASMDASLEGSGRAA